MSDYTNPNVSPEVDALRSAFGLCIMAHGRDAAVKVCTDHGATPGAHPWRHVPANRVKAATAALEALAAKEGTLPKPPRSDKTRRLAVASADDAFADIRKRTYGEKPEAKRKPMTAADLDPVAIYDRWNAAKARGELDDDYED